MLLFFPEWAATIIQTQARQIIAKKKYHNLKKAISILQGAMRAWSAIIMKSKCNCLTVAASPPWQAHGTFPSLIPHDSCTAFAPIILLASVSFQGTTTDISFSY